ncbi:hypothetical protein UNDKW_0053 [Undibacterium sp. KW1]|nr:hypothetical protein UNDKW_0053 [Undibacterium sp. KW1]
MARDDNLIRIEVIDQGAGIPENFRDRLFQKFSQADSSDTRAKGGTGLGLAISQAIIRQMHGDIGYYMAQDAGHDTVQPGGEGQDILHTGTHFYIDLPLHTEGNGGLKLPTPNPDPLP